MASRVSTSRFDAVSCTKLESSSRLSSAWDDGRFFVEGESLRGFVLV